MDNSEIKKITAKVREVMKKYQEEYPDVRMDRDYLPFKITEEWGECLQTYLMMTDRGRQKGKSKDEIKEMFSEELADVFAYLLLFAEAENIDPVEAVSKKWFAYIDQNEAQK